MKQGKNQTKIEKAQKMLSQKMAEKKKRPKLSRKIYQDCRISRLVLKPKQSVKKLNVKASQSTLTKSF